MGSDASPMPARGTSIAGTGVASEVGTRGRALHTEYGARYTYRVSTSRGRWIERNREVSPVSVRNALLALLEQGPRYGYQLRAEFEDRTGGTWPLNVGQVYTTLARLERDGLVEGRTADPEGGEARRTYRISDAGRATL